MSEGPTPVGVLLIVGFIFVAVTGLFTFFGSFTVIPAGAVGVVFNTVSGVEKTTLDPGFHLVVPFLQSVKVLDCRTQNLTLENEEAVSSDQQVIHTNVVVNYRPDPRAASTLYQTVGFDFEDKIVKPVVREALKAEIATIKVDQLLATREKVSQAIREEVKAKLAERGLDTELVSLTNLQFSDEYRQAVERKQVALQEAEATKNKLEQAKTEADITRTAAQAEADVTKIKAITEAERIRMISKAMSENPSYLQLEAIQKINPSASVIYVPQGSTNLLIPQLTK